MMRPTLAKVISTQLSDQRSKNNKKKLIQITKMNESSKDYCCFFEIHTEIGLFHAKKCLPNLQVWGMYPAGSGF
jgi:hypothetical protein